MSNFSKEYIKESIDVLNSIDDQKIEQLAKVLANVRSNNGRLFVLGMGGSLSTASHSCNDFRKLCNIETYVPENIGEFSARVNDDGVSTVFSKWLEVSKINSKDVVLVLSVGGGNASKNVSTSIVEALKLAKSANATVLGIVGKDGGYTGEVADCCVIVPPLFEDKVTPHTEGLCSVILHLLVSHPLLKVNATKW